MQVESNIQQKMNKDKSTSTPEIKFEKYRSFLDVWTDAESPIMSYYFPYTILSLKYQSTISPWPTITSVFASWCFKWI